MAAPGEPAPHFCALQQAIAAASRQRPGRQVRQQPANAKRVAELMRSSACCGATRRQLERTVNDGRRGEVIARQADIGVKLEPVNTLASVMDERQDRTRRQEGRQQDELLKLALRVDRAHEPIALDRPILRRPLGRALSLAERPSVWAPHGAHGVGQTIISKHGCEFKSELGQDKRLSRKLNKFIRSSLLADIISSSSQSNQQQQAQQHQSQCATLLKLAKDKPKQSSSTQASPLVAKIDPLLKNDRKSESSAKARERLDEQKEREAAGDPDVDGGYAWVILAVIFIINASTFGTARAYGLIFDKLARDYDKSRAEAALPFTIMGAVENMAGPLTGYLLAQWSNSWRKTVFAGSCLISLAHFLNALAVDSQAGQLVSIGLLGGLGLSLVSISFFQLNNAYFVRYRSTAFGLGMTGAALGTLYISPLCQYCLDNYGIRACYIMLGAILLPNVPLSLLLKPKGEFTKQLTRAHSTRNTIRINIEDRNLNQMLGSKEGEKQERIAITISERVDEGIKQRQSSLNQLGLWNSLKQVVLNPLFHLIWPTQLLFCWLNFVFGMIIVDFGKDRGLDDDDLSKLLPCWAIGQLIGRLCLSSLVDFKCLSYKSFTVICLFATSITICLLNYIRVPAGASQSAESHAHLITLALVFCLSMFIALLYILFNGLVVKYVEPSLQSLSIGISSFAGSFFLLPRAYIIGLYRQTSGNYDGLLAMFALVTLAAALVWLLIPPACSYVKQLIIVKRDQLRSRSNVMKNLQIYSAWKLANKQAHICIHQDLFKPFMYSLKLNLDSNEFNYNI